MTIHKQVTTPLQAQVGDAWTDDVSFKRVLSRGGAWENVTLGTTHPDELNYEQQQQATGPETGRDGTEVSSGAGQHAPGDGDDGQNPDATGDGEQNKGVDVPAGHESNDDVSESGEPLTSTGPIEGGGEGVDSDHPPVV